MQLDCLHKTIEGARSVFCLHFTLNLTVSRGWNSVIHNLTLNKYCVDSNEQTDGKDAAELRTAADAGTGVRASVVAAEVVLGQMSVLGRDVGLRNDGIHGR